MVFNLRSRKSGGFSLVEILIAIIVLSLGLIGIFAIFPAARESLVQVETETYASMIAQNVKTSIEMGMARMFGKKGSTEFFLYTGPGVSRDGVAVTANWSVNKSGKQPSLKGIEKFDCFVALPTNKSGPLAFPKQMKGFQRPPNKSENNQQPRITRVYPIGADMRRMLKKYESDDSAMTREIWEAQRDPLHHYSYAFVISRAKPTKDYAGALYLVQIYVYRNFPEELIKDGDVDLAMKKRGSNNVYETAFYLSR